MSNPWNMIMNSKDRNHRYYIHIYIPSDSDRLHIEGYWLYLLAMVGEGVAIEISYK